MLEENIKLIEQKSETIILLLFSPKCDQNFVQIHPGKNHAAIQTNKIQVRYQDYRLIKLMKIKRENSHNTLHETVLNLYFVSKYLHSALITVPSVYLSAASNCTLYRPNSCHLVARRLHVRRSYASCNSINLCGIRTTALSCRQNIAPSHVASPRPFFLLVPTFPIIVH